MTFGEKLAELRVGQGLTQEDLGKKIGLQQATISAYERNYREPNFATCEKLADALNVSPFVIMMPALKNAGDGLIEYVADCLQNDPKRKQLLKLSYKLNSSDLDAVLAIIKAIIK